MGNNYEESGSKGNNERMKQHESSSSGYLVFIGAYITRVLLVVLMQNGGIFLLTFQREFNVGAALAGWLGSLPIATSGFIGLLTGAALRRWSCRKVGLVGAILLPLGILSSIFASSIEHLLITFAIITGIGGGMLWLTTVVVVEKHFTERFALAHSMTSSGSNIGKMVLPPFIRYLINTYGWRGALLIEGAVLFHCVAAAGVFKSTQHQRTDKKMDTKSDIDTKDSIRKCDKSSNQFDKDISDANFELSEGTGELHDNDTKGCYVQIPNTTADQSVPKSFWIQLKSIFQFLPTFPVWMISLVYFFHSFGYVSISMHSVAKAEESGVTSYRASYLLSLIGVGGTFGRIMNGVIVDRGWLSPIGIEMIMTLFICIVTFIASSFDVYIMEMTLTCCLGFAFAFLFTTMPVLLKQMDGTSRFSVNLGFVWAVGAFGALGGGPMTGLIRDMTGSYDVAFYLAGAAFFMALISLFILYILDKRCY